MKSLKLCFENNTICKIIESYKIKMGSAWCNPESETTEITVKQMREQDKGNA